MLAAFYIPDTNGKYQRILTGIAKWRMCFENTAKMALQFTFKIFIGSLKYTYDEKMALRGENEKKPTSLTLRSLYVLPFANLI